MQKTNKITKQQVKIIKINKDFNGELSDKIYYECEFCRKTVGLYPDNRRICEQLSGDGFYCSFCLRNNFNTKLNKNIFVTSFRSIFSYYYYAFHVNAKQIFITQIEDYVKSHIETGLQNPLFKYDSDTFLWFIDFSRVGRKRKKIKLFDINKHIINILSCFNMWNHIPNVRMHKLYEKYKEAIEKFHVSRYRPEGKFICLPTLSGCFSYSYNTESSLPKWMSIEDTKYFAPKDFFLRT